MVYFYIKEAKIINEKGRRMSKGQLIDQTLPICF